MVMGSCVLSVCMMLDADGASPNQGPKNAINDAVVDHDGTVPRYDLEQFAERAKMRSMANELHELRKQQQLASEKGEKQRENTAEMSQKLLLQEHILNEEQQATQKERLALRDEIEAGRDEKRKLEVAKEALTAEALTMAKQRGAMAQERETLRHEAKGARVGPDSAVGWADKEVKKDAKEVDAADEKLMRAIDEVEVASEEKMPSTLRPRPRCTRRRRNCGACNLNRDKLV